MLKTNNIEHFSETFIFPVFQFDPGVVSDYPIKHVRSEGLVSFCFLF